MAEALGPTGEDAFASDTEAASAPAPEQVLGRSAAFAVKRAKLKGAVVFVCGLPRGFDEWALRKFLDQFGDVGRIKLKRSKKTGGSRGFAYVEFPFRKVAEIVKDTLNGYVLFGKTLKAEVIPEGQLLPQTFRKELIVSRSVKRRGVTARDIERGDARSATAIVRQVGKDMKLKLKLRELGIDFTPDSIMPKLSEGVVKRVEQLEEMAKVEASKKAKQAIDKSGERRKMKQNARAKTQTMGHKKKST